MIRSEKNLDWLYTIQGFLCLLVLKHVKEEKGLFV
ncbi:hypothetical protein ACUXJ4_002081 [Bacillus pumilus]